MALEDMLQATKSLLAYVREGKKPEGPNPLPRGLKPWEADLRSQERGGSGNKGWLAHLIGYIQGDPGSRQYLLDRLRWELSRGLMAHEGGPSPTYGGLHLGLVLILWWVSWYRGDEEIQRLAGAWIERVLLVECLTGRREGDRIRLMSPGMRADVDSVTKGRQVESAIVGQLLGIPQDLRLDHSTWWGPLWDAVRACEGVGMVADRVRNLCRTLLGHKPRPGILGNSTDFQRIRLMVPMKFHRWPNGDWFAWVTRSTHPQDPPCMGSGWINGKHVVLWPWEDGSNPKEGGWRAGAALVLDDAGETFVNAMWTRKGELVASAISPPLGGPEDETIGSPDGPDPLGYLPPAPDPKKHPWRQGGRPGPGVGPEPRKPVDVPWDLGDLRRDLQKIRDNDRARWKRRAIHRALATLDRLGAWETLEQEAHE